MSEEHKTICGGKRRKIGRRRRRQRRIQRGMVVNA